MNPSQRGFSKVSAVVLPSTVLACTKDCSREDCHISCRNLEETRSVVGIFYAKDGSMKYENGGKHRTYVACRSCKREWVVEQTGEAIQAVHVLQNLYDR